MPDSNIVTDSLDRGKVGIGTLIVFAVVVLVAVIAAGVIVYSAGLLESQATDVVSPDEPLF
ncbi:hypothetical protein [Natrarchaeobaculum sulfurireducens]|uniref:Flagellin n=1 Tax=Natrarchaeobaculum sulfurireducens TaxID=2044521 RepID=A0A346PGS3_9EURY|nr:hypothetical protein [Natrarchaeobaculum sulfurireducens]AXR78718.1 hypothetical protein AArc1_2403 [Natrarchaeobaculum sulfurireducens]AXR81230.1 hypothetical protein AArcMg_1214 [Natrarchaeobaculum sulfurireducens]